jgi:hypothetical protein
VFFSWQLGILDKKARERIVGFLEAYFFSFFSPPESWTKRKRIVGFLEEKNLKIQLPGLFTTRK